MLTDFKDSNTASTIEADICIIGAGAAGITMAHSLISSGLSVCLLESGGLTYEQDTELLNEIAINKDIKYNIEGDQFDRDRACRLRFFGGTTNHWAGWCAPLDEVDFQKREWVPHSGWPINRQDLEPYYQIAYDYCQVDNEGYQIDTLSDTDHQFPEFESSKLRTAFWKVSPPTRFGQVYRDDLERAENVTVYLHANVVKIDTQNNASSVTQIEIQSLDGKKGTVIAKNYVLACGALENVRILLLANHDNPAGLGNDSDWLGRNYQNHPHIHTAILSASDPQQITKLYDFYNHGETKVAAGIAATEQSQQDTKILNYSARIRPFSGYSESRQIWNSLKNFKWPDNLPTKIKLVISDFLKGDASDQVHELYMYTEQAPNTDSRIRLGEDKDALGQSKAIVDWNLTELDKHTVREGTRLFAEEFGRLNLGRVQISDWVSADESVWPTSLWGGCHQIGSTRMSRDPKDGVVNENCRLHSVDNLYVAGSSVFPTGGHVPPTLTIVALAARLAEHLNTQSMS